MHPRELMQLRCKPRNQDGQSQMHPKVLAALWMQLDVFGGQPCLENALYLHTCTHKVLKFFGKVLKTQRTCKENVKVSTKWVFPIPQFYSKTISSFNFSTPENQVEETPGRNLHTLLEEAPLKLKFKHHSPTFSLPGYRLSLLQGHWQKLPPKCSCSSGKLWAFCRGTDCVANTGP